MSNENYTPGQKEIIDFDLHAYYNEDEQYWLSVLPYWNFIRVHWLDQVSEFPDVRRETIEGTDEKGRQLVRHERYDGVVFQRGTDVSASELGLMDQHIYMLSLWCRQLQDLLDQVLLKLAVNEGIQFNNMPYNRFILTLRNIGDLKVLYGWHNPEAGWVAC